MKRALLALAVPFLLAAYLAAYLGAVAAAPPSALEEALVEQGHEVRRAAASPLPALAQDGADAVVLASPGALPAAEQRALLRYVEGGGTLLLAGPAPDAMPRVGGAVRVHPGLVYDVNGGPPELPGSRDALPGARSLDLDGSAYAPLARTGGDAFRDSDGDAKLSLGEPAGPFIVAASAKVGAGRVVLVAVDDASSLAYAPGLLSDAVPLGAERVVLLEPHGAWAAPARALLHAAALASASLLAAAALLLAAGGTLAWLMMPRDEVAEGARSTLARLVADYHSKLARPGDPAARPVPPGEDNA